MDSIESLMGGMSLKKPKKQNAKSETASYSTVASDPLGSVKDNLTLSPKSPVFKPQLSPTDMIQELLLPTSEMDTEDNETLDQDVPETNYYMKKKQHFSCPNGPTLNIWVGNTMKDSFGFEMIEESDAELFNLDEPEQLTKKKSITKASDDDLSLTKKKSNGNDFRRFRSQSENITACTIFKFMESAHISQKRLL